MLQAFLLDLLNYYPDLISIIHIIIKYIVIAGSIRIACYYSVIRVIIIWGIQSSLGFPKLV